MTFTFTESESIAQKVLSECGLEDPSKEDLTEIIFGRGAFYQEKSLESKAGEILTVNEYSVITINSNIKYPYRKRFAAAHELGHFEMHRKITPLFIDSETDLLNWYKGGYQEMEANQFAAEFLMPANVFYNECLGKKFSPEVISSLADRFNVSKTATILQFVKRGNHPVCVVYCKDNKMVWFKRSEDFHPFLKYVHNSPPPPGTVAHELHSKQDLFIEKDKQEDIWKSDWFELNQHDTDSRFYEYCLYVPSYKYSISVIWEK
jgi:Zn-dependent peptidase ImmA (M78 family)